MSTQKLRDRNLDGHRESRDDEAVWWALVFAGAAGGAVGGALFGWIAAIVALTARRLRNAALVRRGGAPIRDLLLPKLWIPGALFGAIGGGATSGLGYGFGAAALAAAAMPLALVALMVVASAAQALRSS